MSIPISAAPQRARFALATLALVLATQSVGAPRAAGATEWDAPVRAAAGVSASAPSADVLSGALDAALDRARRSGGAPGLSMAIVGDDGRLWQGGSGAATTGAPLSADAPQTIASITKAFTAALVMQLVDEGRLRLDAPASRYLPNTPLVRQVTVRQLLAHTSGIPDLYGPAKARLQGSPDRPISSKELIRSIGPARSAPGRGYAYSNTNYYLLGRIVQRVTGATFDEILAERITEPLGLDRTQLLQGRTRHLPAAWSSAFWTSGAMISTPAELARFGHALYGGDLVSDRSRAQMTDFGRGHGYGLGTQQFTLGSWQVPGHSGLLYRTTSLLVHLPDERITIAMFGTAPHTDLASALVGRHGGRSVLELAVSLSR